MLTREFQPKTITYRVCINGRHGGISPNGAFSYTDDFFDSSVDNPPLHAPGSPTVNGNGVYAYGAGVFPTYTNFARNYWVDVVFTH